MTLGSQHEAAIVGYLYALDGRGITAKEAGALLRITPVRASQILGKMFFAAQLGRALTPESKGRFREYRYTLKPATAPSPATQWTPEARFAEPETAQP